jgi:hypothetical protein
VPPAVQNGAAPGAGMVCGAKRIRSLYLPWMTGVTPKLSTTPRPKAWPRSPLFNAAITPWRDALADLSASGGADLPATTHSSRLEAAPTGAFVLTEPTARREGRPYPRSQQAVRA